MTEKNRKGSRRAIDGLRNFNRKHRSCISVQSQKRMDNFKSDKTEKPEKKQKSPRDAPAIGLSKRTCRYFEDCFTETRNAGKSLKTAKSETKKPATTICGPTSVRSLMHRNRPPGKHDVTRRPCKSDMHPSTKTSNKTSTTPIRRRRRIKGTRRVAPSAYAFFVKSYFSEFRKKNPGEKIPFITLSRRCAEQWHSLPNPIKQEFYKMSERTVSFFNNQKIALARKMARAKAHSMRPGATTSKSSKKTILKQPNKSGSTKSQQNTNTKKKSRVLLRPMDFRRKIVL